MATPPRDFREWMRQVERKLQQAIRSGNSAAVTALNQEAAKIREEVAESGVDNRIPAAPVEFTYQTELDVDRNGKHFGRVHIDFATVTRATNGTFISIDFYELWGRDETGWSGTGTAPAWKLLTRADASQFSHEPFGPDSVWRFRVRALGVTAPLPGEWSQEIVVNVGHDTTPPPIPAPLGFTVKLGVLTLTHTGLAGNGAAQPADFSHFEVAFGQEPIPTTVLPQTLHGYDQIVLTGLPYNIPHYFRARGVDHTGNKSNWSAVATATVTPLVTNDISGLDTTLEAQVERAENAETAAEQAAADAVAAAGRADDAKTAADTAQGSASAAEQAALDAAAEAAQAQSDAAAALADAAQAAADAESARLAASQAESDAAQSFADLQSFMNSSGRVLYQEAEPAVEDRSPNNLWIKPSTGETFVWSETEVRWVEVENSDYASAAANAAAAQKAAEDARDAAAAAETQAGNSATAAQQAAADAATLEGQAAASKTAAETAQANALAAQNAATAAEGRASDAEAAATAAQQAADQSLSDLQTAIGESAQIVRQETAPTGDLARDGVLWIKDSTGESFLWHNIDAEWQLVDNVRIAEMAAAADAAADAAEQAEANALAAQGEATTAKNTAATAQSNAEAAQAAAVAAEGRANTAEADALAAQQAAQTAQANALAAEQRADDAEASAAQSLANLQTYMDTAGRIIRQEDEPTGEARNKNNLWIKDSTGQSFTFNELTSAWEEVENEAYAAAAASADAAADRAEAAEAAAQQAEADALTAKNAAEAAQSTADGLIAQADAAQAAAEAAQSAAETAQANAAASETAALAAEQTAIAADNKADAAEAKALEVAGIAATKGTVYSQPDEPARDPNGLWIDTDNGNTPHRWLEEFGQTVSYDFETGVLPFTLGTPNSFKVISNSAAHSGGKIVRNDPGAGYRVAHGGRSYPRDPRIVYSVWVRMNALGTYMAGVHFLAGEGVNGYQVLVDGRGDAQGEMQIRENTGSTIVIKIALEPGTHPIAGDWYQIEAWADATKIYGRVRDAAGTQLGSGAYTDTTYTQGTAGLYGYDSVDFDDFRISTPAGWASVTDQNVVNAAQAAELARDRAEDAEAAAVVARDEAEAAKSTAQAAQGNADAAQAAAEAAEGRADTAEAAASAAQAAAVAAEGRADAAEAAATQAAADANQSFNDLQTFMDKSGRTIYQEAEPAVEDRDVNNLWIKPSDGSSWVWDANALDWVEVVNEAVKAAALAADQSADAAVAAQNAAEQAEADATAAQTAATAAANKATTLEGQAAAAQTAAEAAEQRALAAEQAATNAAADAEQSFTDLQEVMGNSGKVIYQDAEPTGDDRDPNNLWIKDSTGEVFAFSETEQIWKLVESENIRQMALDADAAADRAEAARVAADNAETAATTAEGNAAAAQSAATTARNEATAAQTAAANAEAAAQAAEQRATDAEASATQSFNDLQGFLDNAGKIIHQDAEPDVADRSVNNLWIKDSTGEPYVWNPTSGQWEVVTDQRVVQMAADADAAADAAAAAETAANAAKNEADTAKQNADAAAQQAAGSKTAAEQAAADANASQAAADAAKAAADAAAADAAASKDAADQAAADAGQSSSEAVLAKQAAENAQAAADQAVVDAQNIANTKGAIHVQDTPPVGDVNSMWIDTSRGNKPFVQVRRTALYRAEGGGANANIRFGTVGWAVTTTTDALTLEMVQGYDALILDGGYGLISAGSRAVAAEAFAAGISVYTTGNDTPAMAPLFTSTGSRPAGDKSNPIRPVGEHPIIQEGGWTDFVDGDLNYYLKGVHADAVVLAVAAVAGVDEPMALAMEDAATGARWVHIEPYAAPTPLAFTQASANWLASRWIPVQDQAVIDAAAAVVAAQERADAAHELAGSADSTAKAALNAATHAGKNLFSTNNPSGTAPYGTIWFKHDATGDILGQWQQTGGSAPDPVTGEGGTEGATWTQRQVKSEVIAELDVAKLSGGYIDAVHIQASSLTIGGTTLGEKVDDFDATRSTVIGVTNSDGTVKAGAVSGTLASGNIPTLDQSKVSGLSTDLATIQGNVDRVWSSARAYVNQLTSVDGIIDVGSTSTVVDSPTAVAGKALKNVGQSYIIDTHGKMAFDPTALYRVKVRVRAMAGATGTLYLGVCGWAADGTTYVNSTGQNQTGSQHWVINSAPVAADEQWRDFECFIKGNTTANSSGGGTSPLAPKALHKDVRFIAPEWIVVYQGAGTWETSHVSMEVIDAAGAQALVDAESARQKIAAVTDPTTGSVLATKVSGTLASGNIPALAQSKITNLTTDLSTISGSAQAANQAAAKAQAAAEAALKNAVNVVIDPSFEKGLFPLAYGFEVDATTARTGSKSLKRAALPSGTASAYVADNVPVEAGQTWRFTGWTKTTPDYNGTGSNGKLRISDDTGSNTLLHARTWPNTADWAKMELDFVIPDGMAMLDVALVCDHTVGTIWWDDISLSNVTSALAAQDAADSAKQAAIEAAAADATEKADAAKSEAISAAASTAQQKADAAKTAAIEAAALDAQSKAETAEANAIQAAASDAQTKADNAAAAAETAAKAHADLVAGNAEQAAIDAAAVTAQQKADAAKTAAITAAELDAQSKAETAEANAAIEAARVATEKATAAENAAKQAASDALAPVSSTATAAKTKVDAVAGTDNIVKTGALPTIPETKIPTLPQSKITNLTSSLSTLTTAADNAAKAAAAAQAAAETKVVNGGFEQDFTGWTQEGSSAFAHGIDSAVAYAGGKSFFTTGQGSYFQSGFPVVEGDTWRYEWWYKTDANWVNGSAGGLRLQKSSGGTTFSDAASTSLSLNTEWKLQQVEFKIPAGVTHLRPRIAFSYQGGAKAWVDEIRLTNVTQIKVLEAAAAKAKQDAIDAAAADATQKANTAQSNAEQTAANALSPVSETATAAKDKVDAVTDASGNLLASKVTGSLAAGNIPVLDTTKIDGLDAKIIEWNGTTSRVSQWTKTGTTFIDGGNLYNDSVKTAHIDVNEFWANDANIGSVKAGNIDSEALETRHFRVGTVPQNALAVGIDNLLPNPTFEFPDVRELYPADGAFEYNSSNTTYQKGSVSVLMRTEAATNYTALTIGPWMRVTPGDKFYMKWTGKRYNATTPATFNIRVTDAAGSNITYDLTPVEMTVAAPNDEFVTYQGVVEIPAGGYLILPQIKHRSASADVAPGWWAFSDMELRKVMSSKSETGREVEISPEGLRLRNEEGGEVANLTSIPPNYLGILDGAGNTLASMSDDGTVAGQGLNIQNDPIIKGFPLFGWTNEDVFPQTTAEGFLDYMPRGIVARGYRSMAGAPVASNQEREILELSYMRYPRRGYRIHVSPVAGYINGGYGYLKVYYTTDNSRPRMDDAQLLQVKTVRNGTGSAGLMLDMGTTWYDLADDGRIAIRRYLFTYEALNGDLTWFGNARDGSQFRVWVEDMGLTVPETGVDRTGYRSNGGSTPAPPTTTPEKENYTKTWTANGSRSYYTSGGTYTYNTSKMYQGNSPAVGGLRSVATFDDMTSTLSGATITGMRCYFYFNHWYYNNGGTAQIYAHNDAGGANSTLADMTFMTSSSNWPKPGGRWVNIPSSFWAGFKNGTYKGVGLGDTSPSTLEYGYANGLSTRIEVKYTK